MAKKRKREWTDDFVAALPLAKPGERYAIQDPDCRGLEVRITPQAKTYSVYVRDPINGKPVRRAIGRTDDLRIGDVRATATAWRAAILQGRDPKAEAKREALEKAQRRANTFAAAFRDFSDEKLARERTGAAVKRDMEREFLPALGALPLTEISDAQVAAIIKGIARKGRRGKPAPVQARNLLAHAKRFFQWAIDQRAYGLKVSPCAGLKSKALCGEESKIVRDRVLEVDEIIALWRASYKISQPKGAAYRVLLLTGLRLNEVARAERSELKSGPERGRHWVIPAARMKGRESGEGRAREHVVPLTSDLAEVFDGLPRYKEGEFCFTTTYGKKPVSLDDKNKRKLDQEMLAELRKIAQDRGDDPKKVKLSPWRNHDIRRTVRTNLSRLNVSEEAREAVLAHARTGIKKHYDRYDYYDEKCEALELWAARLRSLVTPSSKNVVPLHATA